MRSRSLAALAAGVVSLTLLASGCSGSLTPTHGRAYSALLRAQTANPLAGHHSVATRGLDSQEAAIVAQGYHHSLTGDSAAAPAEQSILLVAPQQAGAQPIKPSVPRSR